MRIDHDQVRLLGVEGQDQDLEDLRQAIRADPDRVDRLGRREVAAAVAEALDHRLAHHRRRLLRPDRDRGQQSRSEAAARAVLTREKS